MRVGGEPSSLRAELGSIDKALDLARAITIRVGGEPSSLRAELGSIDKAVKLELAPVDKDLCVLTDAMSAIHLLCRWLRRSLLIRYVINVR